MNRIIKANEIPKGYLHGTYKNTVTEQNLNPSFDPKEKSWKLKKILKSDTNVVPWLVEYDNNFYVAKQYFKKRMGGETVEFFSSNNKGKIENSTAAYEANGYVDLEAAVDIFVDSLSSENLPE